jgi:ABC-type polysaccharide/polyol phosphate export permease
MSRETSTAARPRASIWAYRSLIWNFAQRDLKSRFKGTTLGWTWSLMAPLAMLLTYSLVFGAFFKSPTPDFGNGKPGFFPVWLLAGLVPWTFFLVTITISMPTLLANGSLLQKVYFPSFAPILGAAVAILVQTLIEFGILALALVLCGNVGVTWLLFPFWLAIFVVFVTSIALSLAIMNVHIRDLAHLTNVALQLLFFLTPIIYRIAIVPESWNGVPIQSLMRLSPMTAFVESLRQMGYDLQPPSLATWLQLLAWTAAAAATAFFVYRRRGLDIGEAV